MIFDLRKPCINDVVTDWIYLYLSITNLCFWKPKKQHILVHIDGIHGTRVHATMETQQNHEENPQDGAILEPTESFGASWRKKVGKHRNLSGSYQYDWLLAASSIVQGFGAYTVITWSSTNHAFELQCSFSACQREGWVEKQQLNQYTQEMAPASYQIVWQSWCMLGSTLGWKRFKKELFGCYSETTVYINFVASLCPTVQYIIFTSIPFHASMSFIERVLGVVWAWWLSIVCVIFTSFPTLSQAPMGALPPFTSPETRVFLLPIFVAGCQARHAHRQSHVSNTSSAR